MFPWICRRKTYLELNQPFALAAPSSIFLSALSKPRVISSFVSFAYDSTLVLALCNDFSASCTCALRVVSERHDEQEIRFWFEREEDGIAHTALSILLPTPAADFLSEVGKALVASST